MIVDGSLRISLQRFAEAALDGATDLWRLSADKDCSIDRVQGLLDQMTTLAAGGSESPLRADPGLTVVMAQAFADGEMETVADLEAVVLRFNRDLAEIVAGDREITRLLSLKSECLRIHDVLLSAI